MLEKRKAREARIRFLGVPELVLSATLLASDGVVVPLLAFSLSLSFVEGDDDFEKPRWVSLSSGETIRQQAAERE